MRRIFVLFILFFFSKGLLLFSSEGGFSFIVIGDIRPERTFFDFELEYPVFEKMIQDINNMQIKPIFGVVLGDIIKGSRRAKLTELQFNEYLERKREIMIPLYCIPGNHDIKGRLKSNEEMYQKNIGKLYYQFAYRGCLFIFLDTEEVGKAGKIEGEQLQWLEKELRKPYRTKIVFLHRPIFPRYTVNAFAPGNRVKILQLFEKYKVNAIFAGHEHLFNESCHDGILQVISGGGGAPLKPNKNEGFYHFCIVSVENGNIRVKVKRIQP